MYLTQLLMKPPLSLPQQGVLQTPEKATVSYHAAIVTKMLGRQSLELTLLGYLANTQLLPFGAGLCNSEPSRSDIQHNLWRSDITVSGPTDVQETDSMYSCGDYSIRVYMTMRNKVAE